LAYVPKTSSLEEFAEALRRVAQGERYVSPSLGTQLPSFAPTQSTGFAALSPREREIFDLVVRSHTNTELAAALFISVKTVETHRSRINRKLGVRSPAELMRFAALSGIVPP
jgi:DNA-binding NarL/FixJ family response regulator